MDPGSLSLVGQVFLMLNIISSRASRPPFCQHLLSVCFVPETTLDAEIQTWVRHSPYLTDAYSLSGDTDK